MITRFQRTLRLLTLAFVAFGSGIVPTSAFAEYTHLFELTEEVAAFDVASKELHLVQLAARSISTGKKIAVKGQVSGVTAMGSSIAVATGMGRGDLQAPIRVTLYSRDGKEQGVVFEKNSERPQVTYLKAEGEKLWITFFESKFITKTGYFTQASTYPWAFTEVVTERLGDTTAILGGDILVGRPYGEPQGQDGDVLLVSGNVKTTLPSYRGVRSIATWNSSLRDAVVIGDGWHQNYGQLAQGRVSMLTWSEEAKRYALQIIDRDPSQYNFNKLIPVSNGGTRYLGALGNKSFHFYRATNGWQREILYTRAGEETFFDVAFAGIRDSKARFIVLDKELHVVEAVLP